MSSREIRRFELTLHYVGTAFHGWQVQPTLRTVQGELEAVLARVTGAPRSVRGSSRTDTGVHATGQVATVDLPPRWTAEELQGALNALLPRDVWVERARPVPEGFHARYDAVARTYEYRLGLASDAFSPFHRPYCWALDETPDRRALDEAAALLPGERSFLAFAKAGQPHRGDRCTVHEARWGDWPGLGLAFTITANRYLHRMVRYLVGTMVAVALARRPLADLVALLEHPEGDLVTSPPAPAAGLYLAGVAYRPEAYTRTDTELSSIRSTNTP